MDLNLSDYIKHPEKLDKETLPRLEKLVGDYPYFQPARLLYLQSVPLARCGFRPGASSRRLFSARP